MPDWRKSMTRTFEYYTVDPGTWMDVKKLTAVTRSTISWDAESNTLGTASMDVDEEIGECYVRIYLITIQNGVKEKFPLGTFLVQTPSTSFDGKRKSTTVDAYTPLLELKENPPDLGYSLLKGDNIMDRAYMLVREHARAPVARTENSTTLQYDFVADTSDTWLSFISDLIGNAKYEFTLDELGRILFTPKQDIASLQPVWEYSDDEMSILLPEISTHRDLFDIPNVIEVVYSNGAETYYATVVNDDPNSPVSTVSRGRVIKQRITNPKFSGIATNYQIQEYAKQLLREASTIECTISYKHGYCPVRMGDCVLINYSRAGLYNVKAKVISQNITCDTDCQVSEKAIFTTKLWG